MVSPFRPGVEPAIAQRLDTHAERDSRDPSCWSVSPTGGLCLLARWLRRFSGGDEPAPIRSAGQCTSGRGMSPAWRGKRWLRRANSVVPAPSAWLSPLPPITYPIHASTPSFR